MQEVLLSFSFACARELTHQIFECLASRVRVRRHKKVVPPSSVIIQFGFACARELTRDARHIEYA